MTPELPACPTFSTTRSPLPTRWALINSPKSSPHLPPGCRCPDVVAQRSTLSLLPDSLHRAAPARAPALTLCPVTSQATLAPEPVECHLILRIFLFLLIIPWSSSSLPPSLPSSPYKEPGLTASGRGSAGKQQRPETPWTPPLPLLSSEARPWGVNGKCVTLGKWGMGAPCAQQDGYDQERWCQRFKSQLHHCDFGLAT